MQSEAVDISLCWIQQRASRLSQQVKKLKLSNGFPVIFESLNSKAMSTLIEEANSSLSPEESLKNFSVLQRILTNVIANPGEGKYRTLTKSKLEGKLSPIGIQILMALGFTDMGEALVLPSGNPGDDFLQAKELLDCLTMSADGEPIAEVDAEDAELAEALRLSMDDGDPGPTKRPRPNEEDDRALAERLERDEPDERTEVSFERRMSKLSSMQWKKSTSSAKKLETNMWILNFHRLQSRFI